jgi:regulator of protease activity HflC (stomatin/prohibitin superfamily)
MSTLVKVGLGAGALVLAVSLTAGQFTTINTGENGLYVNWQGQVKNEILRPGLNYDGFGNIKVFNTRKITVTANDLRPKTKDNTIMKEMDVTVTYSINPTSLYEFYTGYDITNHGIGQNGQIQLMSSYISRLITSAVNQSVDEFPALAVNSSLDQIQDTIKTNLTEALKKNGLEGKIDIDSVIVGKADLPDDLVASVNRVVAAQSANKEQEVRTRTAQLKAEENKALASTVSAQSLEYQRNEILKAAMENGSIQKILINGAPILSFDGATVLK